MTRYGFDVFAGRHCTGGQGAKQRAVARRGMSEQVEGQRRQFRDAERPRYRIALGKRAEGKGRMEVVSEEQVGTTFTLKLPVNAHADTQTAES